MKTKLTAIAVIILGLLLGAADAESTTAFVLTKLIAAAMLATGFLMAKRANMMDDF